MYLHEQFQAETGLPDEILENTETLQELSLQAERAKKLLSAKPKAPIPVNYNGEHVRVVLTREDFDRMTEDLLTRTIDYTKDIFVEAEKKGYSQSDVSEILLVGGSSKMPQVMTRIKNEFGIEAKMFDPDEAVAKGAAIYANNMQKYNDMMKQIAEATGQTVEEVKERIDSGETDIEQEAAKANISTDIDGQRFTLGGGAQKIINVSSRSFGMISFAGDVQKIFNLIVKNDELPKECTETFYPRYDNQQTVLLDIQESMLSEKVIDDLELGKAVGTAELTLAPNTPASTEIEVTFKLNEAGLLEVKAREAMTGNVIEASFETKDAMTEEELSTAIRRSNNSNVD